MKVESIDITNDSFKKVYNILKHNKTSHITYCFFVVLDGNLKTGICYVTFYAKHKIGNMEIYSIQILPNIFKYLIKLENKVSIHTIYLLDNKIDKKGAKYLGKFLNVTNSTQQLEMCRNIIDHTKYIANGIKTNRSLKKLIIMDNAELRIDIIMNALQQCTVQNIQIILSDDVTTGMINNLLLLNNNKYIIKCHIMLRCNTNMLHYNDSTNKICDRNKHNSMQRYIKLIDIL